MRWGGEGAAGIYAPGRTGGTYTCGEMWHQEASVGVMSGTSALRCALHCFESEAPFLSLIIPPTARIASPPYSSPLSLLPFSRCHPAHAIHTIRSREPRRPNITMRLTSAAGEFILSRSFRANKNYLGMREVRPLPHPPSP